MGCAATVLVTLLVVLLAVGWWRNWYDVSGRDAPEEMEFGLRIHKEEVERDLGKLRDETQRLTESAQVAAEMETIEGTVTELSPTQLTVRVGERDHSVAIDEVTQFYVENDQVSVESLNQGDQVRVTYQQTDAQKRASRVTVMQDEQQTEQQ